MNRIVVAIGMGLGLVCASALMAQQAPKGYELIWSDEFNKPGMPDTSKWRFESGFERNEEMQWYQADNATCAAGMLVITGKRENKPNPTYQPDAQDWRRSRPSIEFTSASLVMKKMHAFQYGRLEVRAKIDAQTGLWPAIWTLGVAGTWPSNGEVDLMEYYDDKILANFAVAGKKPFQAVWDSRKIPLDSLGGRPWAEQFHVWTLDWDEHRMQIWVDHQLLNEINLDSSLNKSNGINPFKQPHFVLLNLAMGGNRGGSLANTQLPSVYLVDYVRIYQKKKF